MTVPWEFVYLLPGVRFETPIEAEPLVLVPPNDPRLKMLAARFPGVAKLTSSFTNQFGTAMHPSAILIRTGLQKQLDSYAVACFRNAIALSALIESWSHQLSGGNTQLPMWSDHFDFYPFTTGGPSGNLAAFSVASMEMDKPQRFHGQKAPHLPLNTHLSFATDAVLLEACLIQWKRRFVLNHKERKSSVLFRSLEIAYQALRVPGVVARTPTIHDFGISIALWVSAFEILSHPKDKKASLETVIELLGRVIWSDSRIQANRQRHKWNKTRRQFSYSGINAVQKLYCELYRARNDFLHGNQVNVGNLFPLGKSNCPSLSQCAPLIFRAAIMAFLYKARRNQNNSKYEFPTTFAQYKYEEAILRCMPTR